MRTCMLLVAVVVLGLLASSAVCAKPGTVTVRVVDVDQNGKEKRVAGAIVEIWKDGEIVKSGGTGANGEVSFTGLEGKTTYTIRVVAPDGQLGSGSFTTNKNGGAGLQQVNI